MCGKARSLWGEGGPMGGTGHVTGGVQPTSSGALTWRSVDVDLVDTIEIDHGPTVAI